MIKGLSIFSLVMMFSLAAMAESEMHPAPNPVQFLRGELAETVKVSFDDENMKPRSYKGHCHGVIHFSKDEDISSFMLSSYNCQDGMQNDNRMRFKAVEGEVFMVNAWGEIDEERGAVGTYVDGTTTVSFERTRNVHVPYEKLDEDGCPLYETRWEDVELKDQLTISFKVEKGEMALTRNTTHQRVVSKMVRLNKCRSRFYRKNVVSTRTKKMVGTLK
jgi:hypothetical protein